jgi:FkbM family methyltransferase
VKRLLYRLRNAWHADLRRELQSQTDRLIALGKIATLGPERTITFSYFGEPVRFFLPNADVDAIQTHILVNETFRDEPILRYLHQNHLRGGGRVVDVGANIGNHTVFFGRICRADSIVAIEPSPPSQGILRRNVELNELSNVEIRGEAVGAASGQAAIATYNPRNTGGTAIAPSPSGTIRLSALDEVVRSCDFLKIDVEGMAVDVLRGAAGLLSSSRPRVLIELHPREYRAGHDILRRYGYRQSKAFKDGETVVDFLFEPG